MDKQNRRAFLQTSAGALAAGLSPVHPALSRGIRSGGNVPASNPPQIAQGLPENEGKKPLRLGLILGIGRDPNDAIAKVRDLGLPTCQAFVDEIDSVLAGRLHEALNKYQIEATSLVVGGPGREAWDFYEGPLTIGLVPRETRDAPITHVRAIQDVGLDNQGVNFDLANLILYGKANPVDAIELLGPYVQGIHAKDGLWPTNPRQLGQEVAIGKGKVDFPRIIARLKELNYRGAVTIEREISGPQQVEDVRAAKVYLEKLIA